MLIEDSFYHYRDRFTESGNRILTAALEEACRRNQHIIFPDNILLALLMKESDKLASALGNAAIKLPAIKSEIDENIDFYRRVYWYDKQMFSDAEQNKPFEIRIDPKTTVAFKCTFDKTRSEGRRQMTAEDLIDYMVNDKKSILNEILRKLNEPLSN